MWHCLIYSSTLTSQKLFPEAPSDSHLQMGAGLLDSPLMHQPLHLGNFWDSPAPLPPPAGGTCSVQPVLEALDAPKVQMPWLGGEYCTLCVVSEERKLPLWVIPRRSFHYISTRLILSLLRSLFSYPLAFKWVVPSGCQNSPASSRKTQKNKWARSVSASEEGDPSCSSLVWFCSSSKQGAMRCSFKLHLEIHSYPTAKSCNEYILLHHEIEVQAEIFAFQRIYFKNVHLEYSDIEYFLSKVHLLMGVNSVSDSSS